MGDNGSIGPQNIQCIVADNPPLLQYGAQLSCNLLTLPRERSINLHKCFIVGDMRSAYFLQCLWRLSLIIMHYHIIISIVHRHISTSVPCLVPHS